MVQQLLELPITKAELFSTFKQMAVALALISDKVTLEFFTKAYDTIS